MPRNGSGVYTPPLNSWNPAIDGALATPGDWNTMRDDIASALSQSLSSDGQTEMTGQLNMGGNRITQLGAPIGQGQALRWEQLQKGADIVSSATLTIPVEGAFFDVTGTATITSIATTYPGKVAYLRFAAGITLVNSISLILPGSQNIKTVANDIGIFLNSSPGVWTCVVYRYSTPRYFQTRVFTANNTFIVPDGVYEIFPEGVGGGGAGGGGAGYVANNQLHGAGGGAGAPSLPSRIPVTPTETLTIEIGAGGTAGSPGAPGGAGGAGGNGGVTRILRGATPLLSMGGGSGGAGGASGGPAAGGAGFPAGGNGQAIIGNAIFSAVLLSSGAGGSSVFGGGGQSVTAQAGGVPGKAGGGLGSGGSGGCAPFSSGQSGGAGGAGQPGFLVIRY